MMTVVMSIYNNVMSCVIMSTNDNDGNVFCNKSEMFGCENGLREGENLSPLLFSMYVNDLQQYLQTNECAGVSVLCNDVNDNNMTYYLKMLLLMYADDTVLFATSRKDLQTSLNAYSQYCKKWKLNINIHKTKIICFGAKRKFKFTLNFCQPYRIEKPIS